MLANPLVYDGKRITVRAWAVAGRDHGDELAVWLYLTHDAIETTATQSVVVLEGAAIPQIANFLEKDNERIAPRQLSVTGDFEVFKPDAFGKRSQERRDECCRFGVIRNIVEWSP